jgi:hypothetical protein
MNLVNGSLSSDNDASNSQTTTQMLNEQILPSNDDCSNDMISVSSDKSETNINKDTQVKTYTRGCRYVAKPFTIVTYGPIKVRVINSATPNLNTGRRSKFTPLDDEEDKKREVRRQKNRESAKRIKERRISIENQLLNEITELESNEKDLTQDINNLRSYKQFLERLQQQKTLIAEERTGTTSLKSSQVEHDQQNISVHCESRQTQEDSDPSSPAWQLLFSI